jgi:hypothetical protein
MLFYVLFVSIVLVYVLCRFVVLRTVCVDSVVLCIVCMYMRTVLLLPGVNPIAVKCIISYHTIKISFYGRVRRFMSTLCCTLDMCTVHSARQCWWPVNTGRFLQVALTAEREGSVFLRNVGQLPPPADRHLQVHCRENLGTCGLINSHPFIYARERETRTVEDRLGKA